MDLKQIKEVIRLMKENDLTDFELEKEGFKIVLRKENKLPSPQIIPQIPQPYYAPQHQMPQAVHHTEVHTAQASSAPSPKEDEKNIAYILSPMVGTFYAAPSPESPPYVQKGQQIGEDDIVCIVEAMKVFNEINAEVSGTIVEILVENGSPVEFGQKLFKVKKA